MWSDLNRENENAYRFQRRVAVLTFFSVYSTRLEYRYVCVSRTQILTDIILIKYMHCVLIYSYVSWVLY